MRPVQKNQSTSPLPQGWLAIRAVDYIVDIGPGDDLVSRRAILTPAERRETGSSNLTLAG